MYFILAKKVLLASLVKVPCLPNIAILSAFSNGQWKTGPIMTPDQLGRLYRIRFCERTEIYSIEFSAVSAFCFIYKFYIHNILDFEFSKFLILFFFGFSVSSPFGQSIFVIFSLIALMVINNCPVRNPKIALRWSVSSPFAQSDFVRIRKLFFTILKTLSGIFGLFEYCFLETIFHWHNTLFRPSGILLLNPYYDFFK